MCVRQLKHIYIYMCVYIYIYIQKLVPPNVQDMVTALRPIDIYQGCPNLVLEGRCPEEFSSNLAQHTCREVSSTGASQ